MERTVDPRPGRPGFPAVRRTLRRPVAAALMVLAAAWGGDASPLDAQEDLFRFDVRLGATYSGTLATGEVQLLEDQGTDVRQAVEIRADVGPFVDAALQFTVSPQVDGSLRLGVARSGLTGTGPSGDWDAGDATAVTALAGLDLILVPRLVIRGGLGKLFYSSKASLFAGGASTGLLLSGGLGYVVLPGTSFSLRLDGDAQWHGMGSPALREAGAPDGSTFRILVGLAATFGGPR